jgi:hypothetical protein
MSDENDLWPISKFYFKVILGSQHYTASFQEISGLDTETQPIEYRHDDSKHFSTISTPGIVKTGRVTLKKGIFVNANIFWD